MTKQIETIGGHRGFSSLNPRSTIFQIAALALIISQFPSIGQAQGGLVDLYSWTDKSSPYKGLIDLYSSNSATFIGNYNGEGGFNDLVLAGSLNTTPGATYEISFTLQDKSPIGDDGGSGSFLFGNSEMNLDGTFRDSYITNGTYEFPAVNYDFMTLATSSTTTMSFDLVLDEGLNTALSNLAVTEITPAPEISSGRMFFYGGCIFLFAKQLQRFLRNRKRAIKAIA